MLKTAQPGQYIESYSSSPENPLLIPDQAMRELFAMRYFPLKHHQKLSTFQHEQRPQIRHNKDGAIMPVY